MPKRFTTEQKLGRARRAYYQAARVAEKYEKLVDEIYDRPLESALVLIKRAIKQQKRGGKRANA